MDASQHEKDVLYLRQRGRSMGYDQGGDHIEAVADRLEKSGELIAYGALVRDAFGMLDRAATMVGSLPDFVAVVEATVTFTRGSDGQNYELVLRPAVAEQEDTTAMDTPDQLHCTHPLVLKLSIGEHEHGAA